MQHSLLHRRHFSFCFRTTLFQPQLHSIPECIHVHAHHAFFEVDALDWADVYHFTLGWPHEDRRVDVTGDPYSHVDDMYGVDRDTIDTTGQ